MENTRIGPRLIIVCGLPGSGKTTRARLLEHKLDAVRFCPDEWMDALGIDHSDERSRSGIEALQWRFAERLLALGGTVVIEWGTWSRSERDQLRLEARSLGVAVELHYLKASVDVLLDRIQRRAVGNPAITRDALLVWEAMFEAPTHEEMTLFDSASF